MYWAVPSSARAAAPSALRLRLPVPKLSALAWDEKKKKISQVLVSSYQVTRECGGKPAPFGVCWLTSS